MRPHGGDGHGEHGELVEARVGMVRRMDEGGVVLSSRLAEVFLNVPRHRFVPVFYRRDGERFLPCRRADGDAGGWAARVYADDSLITEVDGLHAEDAGERAVTGVPTSSSTAPSLMADMLDALDVEPGARVLEVGTGTGYNAALLCRLAGAENVVTVDVSERLTAAARERLEGLGLSPVVETADGAAGAPGHPPFDRIIATCSVRRVPAAWIDQCATGGILVVPLKGTLAGGVLARLTKLADGTAAGHLLHTPAAFMPLLSGPRPAPPPAGPEGGRSRETPLSGSVLDDWTFSFFAQLHLGAGVEREHRRAADGAHTTLLYDPADGSRARVTDHGDGRAGAAVAAAGPRDLWAAVECAHRRWRELNRPRREWFTVRATPRGQTMAYTSPAGRTHTWEL
ncbi:methyltransferase domain-containing protein [Streptomyces chitinivorans]|uniref:Protein-L-isoaspartate O-methyltransferase n=1 Tax=Streptomyces chitinivorans TaxID=1257027 RepID=A0ABW7HPT8_9ACTN|nr:methyltransferase domain-containing protein [Streptomyces chitinivorans]MDH2410644.1 methyltransferase domain-containing protein [Streptomyces chitinivorans]